MPDAAEPWLLIDVDGVISPMGRSDAWPDFRRVPEAPFRLRVSERMGAALAALPARRMWLTTWDEGANEWVGPALGWDHLPVVERLQGGGHFGTRAKLQGLITLLESVEAPPPAVLWCEDGLADPVVRREAASALRSVPHRLLAPDPRAGLTPQEVDDLRGTLRIDET